MNALIVVDLQKDFLPGGALAVPEGDQVVPLINELTKQFSLAVATHDWHPSGHRSFASAHPGHEIGETVDLDGTPQILWPDHCVQGTAGAEFAAGLEEERIDLVLPKGTDPGIDSYSGFFDNGRVKATGLEEFLKQKQVTHCYIAGLTTDYCVRFTALDAVGCGFDATVIRDACRPVNLSPGDEEKAVDEMERAGISVIDSSEIDWKI